MIGWLATFASARSSSACTDGAFFRRCQPQ
ncbi:hypothetical protein Q427_17035 [Halomonas sp. BC04]|nr:hypothetical protein Q427_17035 [Halomonas sp. BC04]